ncbi:MAG: hypothetical protein JSR80_04295 [Verrucomicrobia bacterium]|nr:hypothetical protein [Verrucomicrobiota bacterium]
MRLIFSYSLMCIGGLALFIACGYWLWNRDAIHYGRLAPYEHLYPHQEALVQFDQWTQGYLLAESQEQVAWVRDLLGDLCIDSSSTLQNIESLTAYLLGEMPFYMGVGEVKTTSLSGLQVLEALLHGRVTFGGDALALAYVAAANALGIPSRIVAIGSTETAASHPAHFFAESYVKEHDTWAFVDLSSRKAYVTTPQGRPLNTVELSKSLEKGDADQLVVALYQGGKMIHTPYAPYSDPEKRRFSEIFVLCYPRAGHLYGPSARRTAYEICFPKQTFSISHS